MKILFLYYKDKHGVNTTPGAAHLQQKSQGCSVNHGNFQKNPSSSNPSFPLAQRCRPCSKVEMRLERNLDVLGRCSFLYPGTQAFLWFTWEDRGEWPQEGCRAAQGPLKTRGQRASSSVLQSPSSARVPPLGVALIWGIRIWFHLKKKILHKIFKRIALMQW